MDVIYGLIPMMLFFGFLVVVVFIWMAKKGYFNDMDGQANRILWDDELPDQSTSLENEKQNDITHANGKAESDVKPDIKN